MHDTASCVFSPLTSADSGVHQKCAPSLCYKASLKECGRNEDDDKTNGDLSVIIWNQGTTQSW